MRILIADCNNIAWITRFSRLKAKVSLRRKDRNARELIFFESLMMILRTAAMLECDAILLASDEKKLWRKGIYPEYKLKDPNKEDDAYKDETIGAANDVAGFLKNYSAAMVLSVDNCEADDIISVYVNEFLGSNEAVILSNDKDYMQLMRHNVAVYSPTQDEIRESEDVEFELFLKCVRGDTNDNIPSAYPRVRETKLRKAFDDEFEMINLLETVLPDGSKVGDNYKFNRSLIDMTLIPEEYKDRIKRKILGYQPSSYSNMKSVMGMTKYGVNNKSDVIEKYSSILRTTPPNNTTQ